MSIEWQMAFGNKEPFWIDDTPNAETIAAIEELETDNCKSFDSVEELFEDLNKAEVVK